LLLEAGHSVVGIDQSAGMLARAREHFPKVRYEKIGLQISKFSKRNISLYLPYALRSMPYSASISDKSSRTVSMS
jgi:trans-aconitate methyltransferase